MPTGSNDRSVSAGQRVFQDYSVQAIHMSIEQRVLSLAQRTFDPRYLMRMITQNVEFRFAKCLHDPVKLIDALLVGILRKPLAPHPPQPSLVCVMPVDKLQKVHDDV